MIRMLVDLPAPLGPRKPVTLPGRATNETLSTAVKPPYRFVMFSMVIIAGRAGRERREQPGGEGSWEPS